jgi:hypothetical protein
MKPTRTITVADITKIDAKLSVLRDRERALFAAWQAAKDEAHCLPWGPERRAMCDAYERYNRLQIAADTLRRFRDLLEGYCPDCGSWIERCIMNRVCRVPR